MFVWVQRLQGARQMLRLLNSWGFVDFGRGKSKNGKGRSKAHHDALYKWLMDDISHVEIFLLDSPEIRYTDFEYDKKGRLVKCRAYYPPEEIINQVNNN